MSHDIEFKNGVYSFAFTGSRSAIWHGHGQQMEDGASDDQWKVASGLDFKVLRSKVRYSVDRADANGAQVWDGQHVLFRSDDKRPLAIVSDSYKIVQPAEAFAFFQRAAKEVGLKVDTAGALKQGRKFFATAKFDAAQVLPGDLIDGSILFATSCDGSMNTIVKNVAERVVCANTLAVAMGEQGRRTVKISHRSVFDAERVVVQMGLAADGFAAFIKDAKEMSRYTMSPSAAYDLAAQIMGAPVEITSAADKAKAEKVIASTGFNTIIRLFAGEGRGARLTGVKGTAWGLLNAVTQYYDHEVRATSDDNRRDASMFGTAADAKQDAYAAILARVMAPA